MSIKIFNGYRVRTDNPNAFLHDVEHALGPIRDLLDARLYARKMSELVDGHDHHARAVAAPLKNAALDAFRESVNSGNPGEFWNHPHSLDIDYGYPPEGDKTHLFVLLHCQQDDYRDAFEALDGVEEFPYWNNSDGPDDMSEHEWTQRRTAWEWLIEAPRIRDVMDRWTYRSDPEPNLALVLDTDVILSHLPTYEQRAREIARNLTAAEHFEGATDISNRLGELFEVLSSPRVTQRAHDLIPTLRTITAIDVEDWQP